METLTEMFDRVIKSVFKQGAQPDGLHWVWDSSVSTPKPIGVETSVGARLQDAKIDRLDASTDIGVFLHDDALTRARLRPYATGGVIERPLPLL